MGAIHRETSTHASDNLLESRRGSVVPESSESLVNWLIGSLTTRDFDEPQPFVPRGIHRKLISAIIQRGSESVQPLLGMLNHQDENVRNAAALALGRLQSDETVGSLIHALQNDPSHSVQATVANALNEIGTPEAIEFSRRWKRQQQKNSELVLRNRLNNFVSLGLTDQAMHRRLQELADHYDVDPTDIARSCLTYTYNERQQIRDGNAAAIFGSVMMTEDEYQSIQEIE